MQLSHLLTYRFQPNVGSFDRVFRVLSGLALTVFPFVTSIAMPIWLMSALVVFGLAWLLTGVVSRCGVYYVLGLSSRKGR